MLDQAELNRRVYDQISEHLAMLFMVRPYLIPDRTQVEMTVIGAVLVGMLEMVRVCEAAGMEAPCTHHMLMQAQQHLMTEISKAKFRCLVSGDLIKLAEEKPKAPDLGGRRN